MDTIALAVEIYAENHAAGLTQLVEAVRANDDEAVTLALAILKVQMRTDGARYSDAVVDRVQAIVSRLEERLRDTQDMVKALAIEQTSNLTAMRDAIAGMSLNVELVRAEILKETEALRGS